MTRPPAAGGRPAVAFIAWTPTPGRAIDIAAALGGEARPFYFRRIVNRRLIPVRYLVDALRTALYLPGGARGRWWSPTRRSSRR